MSAFADGMECKANFGGTRDISDAIGEWPAKIQRRNPPVCGRRKKVVSRSPALPTPLWLLPSGPDQIHGLNMQGRPTTSNYSCPEILQAARTDCQPLYSRATRRVRNGKFVH